MLNNSLEAEFAARFAEICGTTEPARIQRLLNISYQAAKNYLNGRLPDARVLLTIADRTPYSIHWLLTGRGEKFSMPSDREGTPILARQISELIRQEVGKAVDTALENRTVEAGSQTIVLRADEVLSETARGERVEADRNR
ncbi:MAG TPA: hypothetical protein VFZ49_00030 [Pyrinomonadaceae bacterium]